MNRGGLFVISDEVYLFFSEIEKKMRNNLIELISKKHIDKNAVIEEVTSDDDVLFHWRLISTDIDDEAASQKLRTSEDSRIVVDNPWIFYCWCIHRILQTMLG